jgi:hypothetical protein
MELISKPETIDEQVTDIDLIFVNGGNDTLTLRLEDAYKLTVQLLKIEIATPRESITYFTRNIIGMKIRERIIRRPVKKEKA